MTSELSNLTARLREFIFSSSPAAGDFDALALELFRFQFVHNPPYRQICEARRVVPKAVEHWTHIPAVPTAGFKELELTSLSVAERTTVFYSSGTSGHRPSRHFHNAESLALYEASLWRWFCERVLPDLRFTIYDLRVAILTPPPTEAPHSSLVHMFGAVRRELGTNNRAFVGKVESDGAWTLDFDAALKTLRGACDSETPLLLLGTAFSFVHLLDHLTGQELRFQLPSGSRVMETGGYKNRSRSLPKAQLHALITQQLGVPPSQIICEYGMSELSSQAYDHALNAPHLTPHAQRRFHFPPWARVQIISPETGLEVGDGKTGLIRVFDLANVFSVLAIQTEDLGVRRGNGFELIGRATLAEPRGCSLMAVNS